jgi:hypothetical protein
MNAEKIAHGQLTNDYFQKENNSSNIKHEERLLFTNAMKKQLCTSNKNVWIQTTSWLYRVGRYHILRVRWTTKNQHICVKIGLQCVTN